VGEPGWAAAEDHDIRTPSLHVRNGVCTGRSLAKAGNGYGLRAAAAWPPVRMGFTDAAWYPSPSHIGPGTYHPVGQRLNGGQCDPTRNPRQDWMSGRRFGPIESALYLPEATPSCRC